MSNIAPHLLDKVLMRRANAKTVKEGLSRVRLLDYGMDLRDIELAKFFTLWLAPANIHLIPNQVDVLVWRWKSDILYSAMSAYNAFFAGFTLHG
jgi:hypothetical protein